MVVVTPQELAAGFRLAGVHTRVARDVAEAARQVQEVCDDPEVGVVGVHEPFLAGFPSARRRQLEACVSPVVVALPAGLGAGDVQQRRARLAERLQRAVGYRLSFAPEEL
jgi:vacuolar-type H+-ATPase subunit F/Vma7